MMARLKKSFTMKFHTRLGSAAAAAAICAALLASAATPALAEYKIGVVITQQLLAETKIGQQAAERLQTKKKSAQEKLDAKASEIQDLQADLAKRVMLLNEDEKLKARDDFEKRQREAQRMKEDLERDLQKTEEEVLGGVNKFLSDLVVNFGKDNGYDLIIDAAVGLYFSEAIDVTGQLVKAADAKYKK